MKNLHVEKLYVDMADWFDDRLVEEAHFGESEAEYGRYGDRVSYLDAMRKRTKVAAVQVINFMEDCGKSPSLNVIRYQLIRSATSTAANYRAACVARSRKEFYAKICIVVEESDETVFWLEILYDSNLAIDKDKIVELGKEWRAISKMVSTARKKAKVT